MEPAGFKMKCPECIAPLKLGADHPGCQACGWGTGPADEEDSDESWDEKDSPRIELSEDYARQRRRNRRRADEDEPRRQFPGYLIGVGMILGTWAALAKFSFVNINASYVLVFAGLVINLIGLGCVFFCSHRDGAERLSYIVGDRKANYDILLLGLVEFALAPLVCLVYLAFHFNTAWKPVSVYAMGLAMIATGVTLAIRL